MIRFFLPASVTDFLKNKFALVFVVLAVIVNASTADAQAPVSISATDQKLQEYNQQAVALLNAGKLEEAKPFIKQALDIKENAVSYYYLCHINAVEQDWPDAIKYGEKTISLDPNYLPVYGDLFYCYTKAGKWKKAESIKEQVAKTNENGTQTEMLKSLDVSLENDTRSKILLTLFFIVLGGVFLFPVYGESKNTTSDFEDKNSFRLSELFLLSASVGCIFWLLFFASSRWIWSFNPHMSGSMYTPSLKMFIHEHDGIESFVLYLLMFANMGVTFIFAGLLYRLRSNRNLYVGVFSVLFAVTGYYFYSIGFLPPMPDTGEDGASKFPMVFGLLAVLSIGGYFLYNKAGIIVKGVFVVLLAYACLVMILPTSLVDLSFVLYPAVRLMNGAKIPEIYFQYDLFLSFVAVLWFKLNFAMETFPYVGQISFFLFFVASFFFADKFFKSKGLAVLFIIAMVIIRYYAIWEVGAGVFQVSPIRLDLWIIPLIVAYWKGLHHWLVGLCLGLLVLFHRNLGLIYLGSYVELIIVLFILDIISSISAKNPNGGHFSALFMKHLKLNAANLLIILASIGLCFVLFKEIFSESALIYRKLGVGMMRISAFSFYWYVPVILSVVMVLLYRFKDRLGERYNVTGMFILFLTIGESMYFYGRSHENNILNVSGLLVMVVFILFDILIYQSPENIAELAPLQPKGKKDPAKEVAKVPFLTQRKVYMSLPFLFIFLSGYYYSGRLAEKCDLQYNNFKEAQYICPLLPMEMDTAAVRTITHNSPNVYFLDFNNDFYYYYYGHYKPLGYYNPCESWIYRKDLNDFMQDLLNKHYYIVYNARRYGVYTDYVPNLRYNEAYQKNTMVALYKADNKMLLPESTPSLFHIASMDTVAGVGMDFANVDVKNDFTIEAIIKSSGHQSKNSAIINNFSRVNQLKGFTFQTNGGVPGQYIFAFSNGPSMPTVAFQLDDNKWHYVAITISREFIKVYDNGKLISSANSGGQPIINSELPLTVGNTANRDAHFSGNIREVRISSGNSAESEIISTGQKLDGELNGNSVIGIR